MYGLQDIDCTISWHFDIMSVHLPDGRVNAVDICRSVDSIFDVACVDSESTTVLTE